MKFTANIASELKAIFSFVAASSGYRDHEALKFVKISADSIAQQVTILATSLDRNVRFTCPAEVQYSGELLYNLQDLIALIKKSKRRNYYPAMEFNLHQVQLSGVQTKINLHPDPNEFKCFSFPSSELVGATSGSDGWTTVLLDNLDFAVNRVMYAASADEFKQVLTGIYFDSRDGGRATCTDGYRLVTVKTGIPVAVPFSIKASLFDDSKKDKLSLTRLLKGLQEHAEDYEGEIKIGCEGRNVFFTSKLKDRSFEVSVRNLTHDYGSYPNYSQLIPNQFTKGMTFDRSAMLEAVEKIKPYASANGSAAATLSYDYDKACFYLTADGLPISGIRISKAYLKGDSSWFPEDRGISFDVDYFDDALRATVDEVLSLDANTEQSPLILSGREGETHLLMPIAFNEPRRSTHFNLVKKFKSHFPAV